MTIPAHAGKTTRKTLRIHSTRDHPRACGKDQLKVSTPLLQGGSPPRMRERHPQDEGKGRLRDHPRACGKDWALWSGTGRDSGSPPRMRERLIPAKAFTCLPGITPAHAGKTQSVSQAQNGCWDHPRACGKDPSDGRSLFRQSGSPPRMRERLVRFLLFPCRLGITPAHAGKTSPFRLSNP